MTVGAQVEPDSRPLVLFDFGNVLALHDRLEICGRLSVHSSLSAQEVCARIFETEIEYDSETGKYDSREHFRRIKSAIGGDPGWSYDEFVDEFKNVFTLNDEAVTALVHAAQDCRVFILSNISYVHSRWLFEQEILATVPESYILSYKVSVMKPDPQIWRIALSRSGVSAARTLFVDDSGDNCAAAQELGIRSIHYRKGVTDLDGEIDRWIREISLSTVND